MAAAEALLLQCINPTLLFPTLFAATTTTSFPPTVSDSPPAVGYDSDEELDGDPSAPHPTDFHNTHGNDLYTALNTTQVYCSYFIVASNLLPERIVCFDT